MVLKLLTSKPAIGVAILKHVWDQEYKNPEKEGAHEQILDKKYQFS